MPGSAAAVTPVPRNPVAATKLTLCTLARRHEALTDEMDEPRATLGELTAQSDPALRATKDVGPDVATILLVAAGDNPDRLLNDPSVAAMCGVSPIQASSGKTIRHRLHRSDNRQANRALWRIAGDRLLNDPETTACAERRTVEGKTRREIVRCLKRYLARKVFRISRLDKPPTLAGASPTSTRRGSEPRRPLDNHRGTGSQPGEGRPELN